MTGGEDRAAAAEDHDPAAVVGLGAHERVVQLDEQAAVLSVPCLGAIEEDPDDGAIVVGLVLQELVVGHGSPREWNRRRPKHDASVRLRDAQRYPARMKIRIDSDACTGHGRCYS